MVPTESAHDTVEALGDIGLLQFKDLNSEKSAFQRTYAPQACLSSALKRMYSSFACTPRALVQCMYG